MVQWRTSHVNSRLSSEMADATINNITTGNNTYTVEMICVYETTNITLSVTVRLLIIISKKCIASNVSCLTGISQDYQ